MAALLEQDERGRWTFTRGKHEGELLDDVALDDGGYLRWLEEESEAFSMLPEEAQEAISEATKAR
jgi:hypothetical protein